MAVVDAYGPRIGLDKVYVAELNASTDVLGGTPTWGTPVLLAGGSVKMTGNPNGNLITDWGDNGPFFVTNSRGNLQATLEVQDIDPAVLALLLGQTRANGITQEGALDQSPYYAMGFRVWIGGTDGSGNKIYQYYWYAKGKFAIPQQGAETKKATISPQHVTLSAEFVKLNANDVLCTSVRTNASDVAAATITNWFSGVVYAASQSSTAVTVGTITGSSSGKTITIPFAKSGETFSMAPIDASDITVSVVSTGLLLAGTSTFAYSVAGVAPTITISNTNIAAVSYLVSVTSDVQDSNGVHVTPKSALVTPA
jgi:phi13 family phage major tail protein